MCRTLFWCTVTRVRFLALWFQQKQTALCKSQLPSVGRWVMERDVSAQQTGQQTDRQGWAEEVWGVSQPWYHICAIYCTNHSESAEPTQRGCVVTPQTRRTLPSQDSTFVMSCGRGCSHCADWPAHFYCPTTCVTFGPQQAIVVHLTSMHKRTGLKSGTHVNRPLTCACYIEREKKHICKSSYVLKHQHALHVSTEKRRHNGFNQRRPKCRVRSPPAAFLSLIGGASSCLTCSPPWQACTQTLITNPAISGWFYYLGKAWFSFLKKQFRLIRIDWICTLSSPLKLWAQN